MSIRSAPRAQSWRQMTFSAQFLLFGILVLLLGSLIIGLWAQQEIRQVVTRRTAAVAALYTNSFIAHHVQGLDSAGLDATSRAALDDHLAYAPLGDDLVAFKLWAREGILVYSTNSAEEGRRFELDDDLARAYQGTVVSHITDLEGPHNEAERPMGPHLLETYAPIYGTGTGDVIAVAEFYQSPDALLADIRAAQTRGWVIIAAATATMYLLLVGLARRASRLIETQRHALEGNVASLTELVRRNQRLQERMREAAGKNTAISEAYLHRISADLHDGPAQDVALALMRLQNVAEDRETGSGCEELESVQAALESALTDIRSLAGGLRMPDIEHLTPVETAQRAIREFERVAGDTVDLRCAPGVPDEVGLPIKITIYRILQEALANSFKHARGASRAVHLTSMDHTLALEITDDGPGFDPTLPMRGEALGLAGMRERVEVLGGRFGVMTGPELGTQLKVTLPLTTASSAND